MTMTDMSGQPRSIEELKEAQFAVMKAITDFKNVPPYLIVYLLTIKDALTELINMREDICEKD